MDNSLTPLPPPIRVGDHLALDFLNTVAAPKGTPIEWLGSGHQFIHWLTAAGVLDQDVAGQLLAAHGEPALDDAAAQARQLREWFRELLTRLKQQPASLETLDIARLNTLLAHGVLWQQLQSDGPGSCQLLTTRRWLNPGALLAALASAIAGLLSNHELHLTRRCENPACTLWFFDTTKGHHRRWCSQAICGNRAKVAAFRERRRSAQKPNG